MPSKGNNIDRSQPASPSTSRSSSAKRKTPATSQDPTDISTPPKKSRSSARESLTPSSHTNGLSVTSSPFTNEDITSLKSTPPRKTFAEMYQFASRSQPNNVVDLTQSNGFHKPLGLRPLGQIGQQGPRRLTVKNLKPTVKTDPKEYLERKWKEQLIALDRVFSGDDVKILLEEQYKATEHICRQGGAEELYNRLRAKCAAHLANDVKPGLLKSCAGSNKISVLQEFVDAWRLWQRQLQTIKHMYSYLNQAYLKRHAEFEDIDQMGMQLYVAEIFNQAAIRDVVLHATVDLIQQDRKGDQSNASLLGTSVETLHDLDVYTNNFEPLLVEVSSEWFRKWRADEAEKEELPHYVRSCSLLLDSEMARCEKLSFDRTTQSQLVDLFDETMVAGNIDRLSNSDSILDMLEAEMNTEIRQCWKLLSRKHQHLLLRAPFSKFTEDEGTAIVFDEKQEADMIIRLLALKKRLDVVHTDCFSRDETMGNALHKSFEAFINKSKRSSANWGTDNPKAGEMIAKHIDLLLKGGIKAIPKLRQQTSTAEGENEPDFDDNETNEESVERHLSDALDLFRFVQGKDVFEAFYKKDFARRLLMGRTQSFDAERSMLNRLRNECGADFTRNLENMFKDMDLAREEMSSYNQLLAEKGIKPSVELGVSVLSIAAWPTYPDIPINLPTSILKAQHDFEKHYKDKHVGRKLTWKPSLAHCQLKARFGKSVKELVVSGFQAIVLLLFNDVDTGDSLTYEHIRAATNLPEAEIKRTLQSLACGMYKVLLKSPKGREVNDTDTFAFNDKFTDARFRVKINQIQLKETKEENKETHKRVAEDRHYETQAAIVRIMKSRKKIGHNELIVEVIKATRSRGVLDQADIKKNIEKLIEKDYMEREDDIKGYSYLA